MKVLYDAAERPGARATAVQFHELAGATREDGGLASLSQTRCFNHGQREAAARCPGCRRHFCRECVTEHDHRLLCASCLEAEITPEKQRRKSSIPFRGLAQFGSAVFVLWVAFYIIGQALLLIPSEFHYTLDDYQDGIGMTGAEEGAADDAESSQSEDAPQ